MASQPVSAPPKRRRRYAPRMAPEQRREHLIDAALEVILERGYAGVSIEAIAREAGHHPAGRLRPLPEPQPPAARRDRARGADLARAAREGGARGPRRPRAGRAARRRGRAVPRGGHEPARHVADHPAPTRRDARRSSASTSRSTARSCSRGSSRWCGGRVERATLPHDLDVELTARTIRDWSEQAGSDGADRSGALSARALRAVREGLPGSAGAGLATL